MVDEGCDIVQEEHIIISAQYWFENNIKTRFLKLLKVSDKKAEVIFQTVKSYLMSKDISFTKMIGICTDGTYSMSSENEGLIDKILKENNGIIFTHCACHRFSLALKDVITQLPYLILYQNVLEKNTYVFC